MEPSQINKASEEEAHRLIKRCCGASNWVNKMMADRPFASIDDLFARAEKYMDELSSDDWKEAFTHHPKIGELEALRQKFNVTAQWEAGEQAGVASATDKLLEELRDLNNEYEKKFGYIFIVCATGKSAEEMLEILKARLPNAESDEIKVSANEQRKITRLRLEKVCQ